MIFPFMANNHFFEANALFESLKDFQSDLSFLNEDISYWKSPGLWYIIVLGTCISLSFAKYPPIYQSE